jgi:HSP20 family protein
MRDRIDQLFEDSFAEWSGGGIAGERYTFYPRVDIMETDKAVIVHCDLPGMSKDTIDVSFKGGNLIISGRRETVHQKSGADWISQERSYGNFERFIPIHEKLVEDKITAEYKDGVLTVTLPKVKEATKPAKKITIR